MDNKPLEPSGKVAICNPIAEAMSVVFNTYDVADFLNNLQEVILDYHHLALNHYAGTDAQTAVLRNVEMLTVLENELRYKQKEITAQLEGEGNTID